MNSIKNIVENSNLDLKQDNSQQKPISDSTSSSINDENQKNFYEANIHKKLNINQNIKNNKTNNMEIQNLNEDIFPSERMSGDINNINKERNLYSIININNQLNSNSLENIFSKYRNII